ncbi:MAG TPA: class II aldolase/adducin family protein [Burkholderiaceae bacterium]|jgi:L-fuculose-phosphate aldolase|nr:class II aldolase/adducin family protein [Burkholderiaceae bacterium]
MSERANASAASAARQPTPCVDDGPALRQQLMHVARTTLARGLNVNKSGNVSARCVRGDSEGLLITPTAIAYQDLTEQDLVFVNLKDGRSSGPRAPSSEWRIHLDILRARGEFGAIVHTHSPCATALSCHGADLPPFHYMIALCGGPDVRCAPYATFGTQELSDGALMALSDRKACLLQSHGSVACGIDLADALTIAQEVEHLSHIYLLARQLGEPPHLTRAQMQSVMEKFRTSYGQR